MTRWRIDVGSTHTLLTEVLDAAADAATPISRGEQALHDAASALTGVDGAGSAMSGLAEEWDEGPRRNSEVLRDLYREIHE